jgi:hypothetical protein
MDRRWFVVVGLVALFALLVAPAIASAAELSGTVKSVAPDAKSVVVTGADGKDTKVTYDDKTKITVGDKAGTAADIKAGAKVKVTHEGGKASAIAIAK